MVESSGANAIVAEPLRGETAMPPQTIERRVEKLEEQMTTLQQLPARMDALSVQISQTREDLGAKISTMDAKISTMGAKISTMDARVSTMDARVSGMDARISGTEKSLREEILSSGDRILTRVRMLHEDVISRLALIQEGRRERSRSPRKK
jgi:uncharacterized coiled-coil DUF342 family protein